VNARIGILGAGGWGTALAVSLQKNGHHVSIWEFDEKNARKLQSQRKNKYFLPGIQIPRDIVITSSLLDAATDKEVLLIALPSHVLRAVGEQLAGIPLGDAILVSCSKGIENYSLLRMTEVLHQTLPEMDPDRILALSGPSHAEEVARDIPTLMVVAGDDMIATQKTQEIFMNPALRVYTSEDVIGVELGGALKNIIAIAAGISDGVGCGDNTKAALMTRGMVEITRLGTAMGASPLTFAGLSGMGDLFVTCMSRHSRNRFVGEQIGRGKSLEKVLSNMRMVAEGVRTTQSVIDLSRKHDVQMPISQEVFRVLFEKKDPKHAVADLMTRDPKSEDWG